MSDKHKLVIINDPRGTRYAVMNYDTLEVVYVGGSIVAAATALEPGTCFGKAMTDPLAKELCHEQCMRVRVDEVMELS